MPTVLHHRILDTLRVAPGATIGVWSIPGMLEPEARARVDAWVAQAQRCDEGALAALQRVMPPAPQAIRRALADDPAIRGGPALRLLLALWER